jgi:putative ABC transport system permease protein
MNLVENIKEGLRSVQANLLRSVLTALIVAIGIMSLVGILTAIDGIETSVTSSLSSLGVNTFDIRSRENRGNNTDGVKEKVYPKLTYPEVQQFIEQYDYPASVALFAGLSFATEISHNSLKTNPNVRVRGINTEFFAIRGLDIELGRNISTIEMEYSTRVAVIGKKVQTAIYENNADPIGSFISFKGTRFKVIGVLKERGSINGDSFDNAVYIPIGVANQMAQGRGLDYRLTIGVTDVGRLDMAMGEATGTMRIVRNDHVGQPNSFELEKSETLAQRMETIIGYLQAGGFGVGFITLLGASIALMNIMLVSVTERTREVGVRKALGATPLRIRQQFIIEAIVVCVLGGIVGILFGILIGNVIARAMSIDIFIVPWLWMFVGFVICVVVGLLSGYYPAFKASKLDPIESLRFE